MELEKAKEILRTTVKHELRDHAFGDCEAVWFTDDDVELAVGYFSGKVREVVFANGELFTGNEADELRKCFAGEAVSRNDSVGPDSFVLGQIMPGLTKDGVLKEITDNRERKA